MTTLFLILWLLSLAVAIFFGVILWQIGKAASGCYNHWLDRWL